MAVAVAVTFRTREPVITCVCQEVRTGLWSVNEGVTDDVHRRICFDLLLQVLLLHVLVLLCLVELLRLVPFVP